MRRFSGVVAVLAIALVLAPLPASATPATLVVDSDSLASPTDCNDASTVAFPTIGLAIAAANSGDIVKVCPGTYNESPDIATSLTLQSTAGPGATIIQLEVPGTPGTPYLASLTIRAPDVTVRGFTILGHNADCSTLPPTLANSNVQLSGSVNTAVVADNLIKVGASDSAPGCSTGDDGFGVLTTYNQTTVNVNSLTVENNIFQPLNSQGTRAFYINPGTDHFTFRGNEVNGKFTRNSLTHAMKGLVDDNVFDGGGLGGRGVGTWGYPDAAVWGHTTFSNNDIKNLISGITINESNNIVIEHNELTNDTTGVSILDGFGAANFDPSTIDIHLNNITGNTTAGVSNDATTPGTVHGTCNWWGAVSGPSPSGTGDSVAGDVEFKPWLVAPAPNGLCIGGVKQVAKIAPTGTTCQQYQGGTAATLGQILYTIAKGGKIGAVSPGVFFYYTRVSDPGTVNITQSHTGNEPERTIPIQMKQVLLYSDPGCATLKWKSLTVSADGTAEGVLPATGGPFIISVKYDSGSLKGKTAPTPSTTSTYTFGTNRTGIPIPEDYASVDLAKKGS
jgi:hypothetical protein